MQGPTGAACRTRVTRRSLPAEGEAPEDVGAAPWLAHAAWDAGPADAGAAACSAVLAPTAAPARCGSSSASQSDTSDWSPGPPASAPEPATAEETGALCSRCTPAWRAEARADAPDAAGPGAEGPGAAAAALGAGPRGAGPPLAPSAPTGKARARQGDGTDGMLLDTASSPGPAQAPHALTGPCGKAGCRPPATTGTEDAAVAGAGRSCVRAKACESFSRSWTHPAIHSRGGGKGAQPLALALPHSMVSCSVLRASTRSVSTASASRQVA